MKKIQVILAVVVALVMASCVKFKTEATVDVEVIKDGKSVGAGTVVYKFSDPGLGEGTTIYRSNATGSVVTDAAGLAHFDLKSPDDFDPSQVGGVEIEDTKTFFFCTYDAEGTRNGFIALTVKTGDKKTVTLKMEKPQQD